MVTITCNCGSSTMKFLNLKEADFQGGWISECCVRAELKALKQTAQEPTPPQEVTEHVEKRRGRKRRGDEQ